MPDSSWLNTRLCEFYWFLEGDYFYISLNITGLCPGTQLSYWESIWSFWGLCCWGESRPAGSLGVNSAIAQATSSKHSYFSCGGASPVLEVGTEVCWTNGLPLVAFREFSPWHGWFPHLMLSVVATSWGEPSENPRSVLTLPTSRHPLISQNSAPRELSGITKQESMPWRARRARACLTLVRALAPLVAPSSAVGWKASPVSDGTPAFASLS